MLISVSSPEKHLCKDLPAVVIVLQTGVGQGRRDRQWWLERGGWDLGAVCSMRELFFG
jgi:hypothetical protein